MATRGSLRELDPLADLKRRVGGESTDRARARAFWSRYLREAAPMARIRACVQQWSADHALAAHPPAVVRQIALALIAEPTTEDKLAGILVLQDVLGDQLRATDLPAFAQLFAAGHLAAGRVVDWFCTKVLAMMLERAPARAEIARALAGWRTAETTWQRRAACVAFTRLAPRGEAALAGLVDLVLEVCATVVWSNERFDQTAVGWVLRELSRAEPVRVERFFRRYARLMSRECARCVVARLPEARRGELLAQHKRATSLGP